MKEPTWVELLLPLLAGGVVAVAGLIMLHPAHSSQARPMLDSIPAPDCGAALPADHAAPALQSYRGQPWPEPLSPPPLAYLTVREGDGERMRAIVRCDARRHGASVFAHTRRGFEIHYSEGWERRLSDLKPWVVPEGASHRLKSQARRVPVPDYEMWARSAAASDFAATGADAEPRPHRIRIIVYEAMMGWFADDDVKTFGWFTLLCAALLATGMYFVTWLMWKYG